MGGRRAAFAPLPPTSPPVRSSYCTAVASFSGGIVGGGSGLARPGPSCAAVVVVVVVVIVFTIVVFVAVNVVVLVVAVVVVVVSEPARAIISASPAREVRRRRGAAYSSYFLYAFVSASSTGPSISADLKGEREKGVRWAGGKEGIGHLSVCRPNGGFFLPAILVLK